MIFKQFAYFFELEFLSNFEIGIAHISLEQSVDHCRKDLNCNEDEQQELEHSQHFLGHKQNAKQF